MERQGNFTQNDKSNVFISWQSYEGLQVTVYSFKEVCKILLEQGISYILSGCGNQGIRYITVFETRNSPTYPQKNLIVRNNVHV